LINNQEEKLDNPFSKISKELKSLREDYLQRILEIINEEYPEIIQQIGNLLDKFKEISDITSSELEFLFVANRYGLCYSILKRFNVHPNHYKRLTDKLFKKKLIQQLDYKYKENWIIRNRVLLGENYRFLLSSYKHREKLKVYIPTEKGEKIIETAKSLGIKGFLVEKMRQVEQKIEEIIQQRIQQQKAMEEEYRKKTEEHKKKKEEEKRKEFEEKLKNAEDFFREFSNPDVSNNLVSIIEKMKKENKEFEVIKGETEIIEIKKIENREIFSKILVNLYDLIQKEKYRISTFENGNKYIICSSMVLDLDGKILYKIQKKKVM